MEEIIYDRIIVFIWEGSKQRFFVSKSKGKSHYTLLILIFAQVVDPSKSNLESLEFMSSASRLGQTFRTKRTFMQFQDDPKAYLYSIFAKVEKNYTNGSKIIEMLDNDFKKAVDDDTRKIPATDQIYERMVEQYSGKVLNGYSYEKGVPTAPLRQGQRNIRNIAESEAVQF